MNYKGQFRYPLTIVLFGTLMLVGCGHVHYPTSYVLNFPSQAARIEPTPNALEPLAIREFQCATYLCEGRIVYRPAPDEIRFYEFHRWAMKPGLMITQFVADNLRSRPLFKSVALQDGAIEPAYVLSGNIERLEEVDQGREVHVVCTISAQLVDVHTKSLVWSHTASETVPVSDRDMGGVVSSMSAAARLAVDRLIQSLEAGVSAMRTQRAESTNEPSR